MVCFHLPPFASGEGVIEHIFKLVDVSGPVVAHEKLERSRADSIDPELMLGNKLLPKELDQLAYIAQSFFQRRQANMSQRQVVVQVTADLTCWL